MFADYKIGRFTGVVRVCASAREAKCETVSGVAVPDLGLTDATGTFCYCTGDLCNGRPGSLPGHPSSVPTPSPAPQAIRCYHCTSESGDYCDDPFDKDSHGVQVVTCSNRHNTCGTGRATATCKNYSCQFASHSFDFLSLADRTATATQCYRLFASGRRLSVRPSVCNTLHRGVHGRGTPWAIKRCHFYFYDNFGKCGPISIIFCVGG